MSIQLALAPTHSSIAQTLDPEFGFELLRETRPDLKAIVKQSDGRIIVVGASQVINRKLKAGIFRLNSDLTLDESYAGHITNTSTVVQSNVAIQADNKFILAGIWGTVNGKSVNGIVRLNTDGSTDESFLVGSGFNQATLTAIKLDGNGRIVVLSSSTTYNGTLINGAVRLNTNGTLDNTFNVGTGFSLQSASIDDIRIQTNGKILLTNGSIKYNNQAMPTLIRLNENGSLDNTFTAVLPSRVANFIIPTENDKLIVIGRKSAVFISRLNSDGSVDNTFVESTNIIRPYGYAQQSDGKIIIVGANGASRINTDGTVDNSFVANVPGGPFARGICFADNGNILFPNPEGLLVTDQNGVTLPQSNLVFATVGGITSMVGNNDEGLILSGTFNKLNGNSVKGLISISKIGALNSGFNSFLDNKAFLRMVNDGNKFIVAGPPPSLARLNADGTEDLQFSNVVGTGPDNAGEYNPHAIYRLSNGKILVAGNFANFNNEPTGKIVRLNTDGSLDKTFNAPPVLTNIIAVIERPDGKILVSDFVNIGINPRSMDTLRLLNSDGSLDKSFKVIASGPTVGAIAKIALDTLGNIYISGYFDNVNSIPCLRIAKLTSTGQLVESFTANSGFNQPTLPLIVQRDQKLLVGGQFTSYRNTPVNSIVRLNQDGTLDESFSYSVAINAGTSDMFMDEGNLYAAGGNVQSISPLKVGLLKFTSGISTPREIVATANSSTAITLTWPDKSAGETNYIIARAENNGSFSVIKRTPANTSSFIDSPLKSNTTYAYRIKATNNVGETRYSDAVTAITEPTITSAVVSQQPTSFNLSLYPNPTHDDVVITFNNNYIGPVNVEVTDLMGRNTIRSIDSKTDNSFSKTVSMQTLPAGLYYISITGTGFKAYQKVIKAEDAR